ncbi:unnamed protein product, partial [Meganyctiphanes norvegica]
MTMALVGMFWLLWLHYITIASAWDSNTGVFKRLKDQKLTGTLSQTATVSRQLQCGQICSSIMCPGYNLKTTDDGGGSWTCSVFSSVDGVQAEAGSIAYQ